MSEHLDGTTQGTMRHYQSALAKIAAGRLDNGRPLSGDMARQIARDCLFELGISWTKGEPRTPTPRVPSDIARGAE